MVLAFTGHRPEKLPWGSDETDPRCAALKRQILEAVRAAAEEGYDTFLCGMARGCDLYFAECVLSLGLRLEGYLPCPSQTRAWSEADRARQVIISAEQVIQRKWIGIFHILRIHIFLLMKKSEKHILQMAVGMQEKMDAILQTILFGALRIHLTVI